jgi:hypothetical protein
VIGHSGAPRLPGTTGFFVDTGELPGIVTVGMQMVMSTEP